MQLEYLALSVDYPNYRHGVSVKGMVASIQLEPESMTHLQVLRRDLRSEPEKHISEPLAYLR
jgi:hypothetical protein